MASDNKQLLIRLTDKQIKELDDARAKLRPIPSLAEMIRRAIDYFLATKK